MLQRKEKHKISTKSMNTNAGGYFLLDQYQTTGQNLFNVSPARNNCLNQRVSSLCKPKVQPSSNNWKPCRSCCQPGFVGGYNAAYPDYSPMTPDNGFFDRQDFPTGSYLPRVGYTPNNNPQPQVPAGCGSYSKSKCSGNGCDAGIKSTAVA